LPLAGESKADPAIGSTLDPNLTLLARQGTTVHLPVVKGEAKGEAGRGLHVWPSEGPVRKFALKFARKPLDI
ncbi:hypothetical protein ACSZM8_10740, partial [Aeromonas caviae]